MMVTGGRPSLRESMQKVEARMRGELRTTLLTHSHDIGTGVLKPPVF